MTMNVGEYGLALNLNVNYTLTGYTSLTMNFMRPDGTTFTSTGVTVPNTPFVAADGTYAASQYARYVFTAGDLNQAGDYKVRLTYQDATKRLVSDVAGFTVNP